MPHTATTIVPVRSVAGEIGVPGDKSISHRYAMLAALAVGRSELRHYSTGADCSATLSCLEALGVDVARVAGGGESLVRVAGRGMRGLRETPSVLDAQNSGTTMRLLAGILAAHPFRTTLTGDASLRRRPMRRVIAPLERMGARIHAADDRPPLTIDGGDLRGIDFAPEVPSAQVKSAVLLAGIHAQGRTIVHELAATRDHTERALRAFGATVTIDGAGIAVERVRALRPVCARIPGDISSAAYWAVAAASLPGSDLLIRGVGLNPTRTAIVDVLRRFGALVDASADREDAGEPSGDLRVRHGGFGSLEIRPEEIPGLIDELPALAALGVHGGSITVRGASELRVKESDRITALVTGLKGLGAAAEEFHDGFRVEGRRPLPGGAADAAGDHRLAMAFAVAALGATGPSTIVGAEAVAVSYPEFFDALGTVSR